MHVQLSHNTNSFQVMYDEEEKRTRKQMCKIKVFLFCFLTLFRVSRTYKVDLVLHVVLKLLAVVCFVYLKTPPIPYVQVAILNLPLFY